MQRWNNNMFRATTFALVLSGYLFAGDIRIMDSNVSGDTVTVLTSGEFRIGEHDTPADMRKQSLDESKIYAAEYIGTYVKNERHLEQVGDAALTRTKSLITTFSAGRMPSEIMSESSDGIIYRQTSKHIVSIKSFLDEIDRQKKIADIEKSIENGPSIESTSDFTAALHKINHQKALIDERKNYLQKFTAAVLDAKFLSCSVSSINELKDGSGLAKYDCLFTPPTEYLENYKLYYQTDICNAHVTKIDLPSAESKLSVKERAGEVASAGLVGLGSLFLAPIWLELKALEKTTEFFKKSDDPKYNLLSMSDLKTTYDDGIHCSPDYVDKAPETKIYIMAYGGVAVGNFDAVEGGKIIKTANFTLIQKISDVSKVKDIRDNLTFRLDSKDIEFDKKFIF